ncbi:hypothetical protein ACF0H5_020057 [Mactra antiquata]
MDVKLFTWTILGLLGLLEVEAVLKCIECTHIAWKEKHDFDGALNIYRILRSKHNPACAQENPFDKNLFDYNQQMALSNQQAGGQFLPINHDIGETICRGSTSLDKCHYIYGNASIYLPDYNGEMVLNIHIRNCEHTPVQMENRCYLRTNQHGNQESRYKIQSRLTFLSQSIQVLAFHGRECYCDKDKCYPYISGSRNVVASSISIVVAFVSYLMLK